jgi:hypothetical protein
VFFQGSRNFLIVSIVIKFRDVGGLYITPPSPELCISAMQESCSPTSPWQEPAVTGEECIALCIFRLLNFLFGSVSFLFARVAVKDQSYYFEFIFGA